MRVTYNNEQSTAAELAAKRGTATDLLRALMSALPKSEFWNPPLDRAHEAATEFLNRKGTPQ